MDLIDVKRTKADKDAEAKRWETSEERDDYPWGLSISINEETADKLGIADKDFDAGEPVKIMAEGYISEDRVTLVNGKARRSMSIQITKLALDQGEAGESIASAMYGE